MPGNRHIAINGLSHHLKVEGEDEDEEDINNFINSQLNYIKILVLKLEKQKDEIFKSRYSFKYQQITYYLSIL